MRCMVCDIILCAKCVSVTDPETDTGTTKDLPAEGLTSVVMALRSLVAESGGASRLPRQQGTIALFFC
uniref:Uncharacterized protein n=1 Tax=Arundo donax TaxID=35708 RepID=A0A0A9GAW4_ARUDO